MIRIVVGYDFSELAELALSHALVLATRFESAELHALTALDDGLRRAGHVDLLDYQSATRIQRQAHARVAHRAEDAHVPVANVFVHARIGDAADELLDLAAEVEADMIVLGTHGRTGLSRLVVGSVAEKVMRHASCPVFVSRPKAYEREARVVIEPAPGPNEVTPHYLEPHIYRYESPAPTRPPEWPLY